MGGAKAVEVFAELGLHFPPGNPGPCDRKALGEQSDKDHRPPRAGETPCGAQIQQQRLCFVGDLRQRILAGQIRAKQERELDGTCASQQVKDGRSLLPLPISPHRPGPLYSLLCFLCDMMESLVLGVLSPLLETRGSYTGAGSKNKEATFLTALMRAFPGSAAGPSMCPLPC